MKKYILSAVLLGVLVACDIQSGGNKNIVKISEDQPRYTDQVEHSEVEPNFSPYRNQELASDAGLGIVKNDSIQESLHEAIPDSIQTVNETVKNQAETTEKEGDNNAENK